VTIAVRLVGCVIPAGYAAGTALRAQTQVPCTPADFSARDVPIGAPTRQDVRVTETKIPERLTLDEAYRAAFYMVLQYVELESAPDEGLVLLMQYLWTDPARWDDWQAAVRRALADGGLATPDHDGAYRDRGEWPGSLPRA
jgi:hypothetical protein